MPVNAPTVISQSTSGDDELETVDFVIIGAGPGGESLAHQPRVPVPVTP